MTVKTRITFFIAAAGLFSSILFSLVVFLELIEQPFDLLDRTLKEEAYRAAAMVAEKPVNPDTGALSFVSRTMDKYWIEICEPVTGKVLFKSEMAELVKLPSLKPGSGIIVRAVIPYTKNNMDHGDGKRIKFRVRTFPIEIDGRSFVVQIARSMEKLNDEIWDLVFGILAGLVFSTLVLVAVSRFLAGKILQPIGRMKDLAQDISEKNLDKRIPHGEGQDEFSELAVTINHMLDRLQYSFVRQRNFLFDTSHELKTPLSTMRLAVDEISTSDGELIPPSVRDNLLRVKNQVLRMERLVKDLLHLSSLETLTAIDPKPVQITELLSSLAEEYKFLADARNIKTEISLQEGLTVQGDGEKLYRTFSNILDNAVKYNIDGGEIELTCIQSGVEVTVTVANTGHGVSADEEQKVFDQFYRAEKSRSVQLGGSGLGLTIVKRIIDLHCGTVRFESCQEGWTTVTVSLPMHTRQG